MDAKLILVILTLPICLAANQWTEIAGDHPNLRQYPAFILANDGDYRMVGGLKWDKPPCPYDIQRYDPDTNEWYNELPFDKIGIWGSESGNASYPYMGAYWDTEDDEGVVRPNFFIQGQTHRAKAYTQYAYDHTRNNAYFIYNSMLWEYDLDAREWTILTEHIDPVWENAVRWSSIVYIEETDELFLFGGIIDSETAGPGTWIYDLQTDEWEKLELDVEPDNRVLSQLAYDPVNMKVLMFGGDHLDYMTSDTWTFDVNDREWTKMSPTTAPSPRAGHALIYLPESGKFLLYGGFEVHAGIRTEMYEKISDAWIYDYDSWEYLPLTGDGPATPWVTPFHIAVDETDKVKILVEGTRWVRFEDPMRMYEIEIDPSLTDPGHTGSQPDIKEYRDNSGYDPDWSKIPNDDLDEILQNMPEDEFIKIEFDRVPTGNFDWDSCLYDSVKDRIIHMGGGHSAHTSTAVEILDFAEKYWYLPYWPEFPLEDITMSSCCNIPYYFSLRPTSADHIYKRATYDPYTQKIYYNGKSTHQYNDVGSVWVYDTTSDDWEFPPIPSPFTAATYTKLISTPHGIAVWGFESAYHYSDLWLLDTDTNTWEKLPINDTIPMIGYTYEDGALMYDPVRDRLLLHSSKNDDFAQMYEYSFENMGLTPLNPTGAYNLGDVQEVFTREWSYIDELDKFMFSHSIVVDGKSNYIGYDPAEDKWILFEIEDSLLPRRPGYSSSMPFCFDSKRQLIFAVTPMLDTYALKLSGTTGDFRPRCSTLGNCENGNFPAERLLTLLSCWKEGELGLLDIINIIDEWKTCS